MTVTDDVHLCDLGCTRPAPHTWICWDCHAELVTTVDSFTAEDLHHLQQIAHRESAPATRPTAHTTHQKGPTVPLHLGALVAHQAITTRFNGTLDDLPNHPDAATQWRSHTQTLRYARELIDGEPEPVWDHATREAAAALDQPMLTRHLIPWLREHCGVRVNPNTVKSWARRGQLVPAAREDGRNPRYRPSQVLALHYATT